MHIEAFAYVARSLRQRPIAGYESVVEIGGRNINGSIRSQFRYARRYTTIDIAPGEGVDVVESGATYQHDEPIDVAVCCEVFEHTADVEAIIANIARQMPVGSLFFMTAAGPERPPHSGVDGATVRDGEHYANITIPRLVSACMAAGLTLDAVEYGREGEDVYATARKLEVCA